MREPPIAFEEPDTGAVRHLRKAFGPGPADGESYPAMASDIVTALEQNPKLRAEVLDSLGHREETELRVVESLKSELERVTAERDELRRKLQSLVAKWHRDATDIRTHADSLSETRVAETHEELAEELHALLSASQQTSTDTERQLVGARNAYKSAEAELDECKAKRDQLRGELAAERARVRDMADERDALLTLAAKHSAEILQTVRIAKFMQDCREKTAELCSSRQPDQKRAATTEEQAAPAQQDSRPPLTRADVLSIVAEVAIIANSRLDSEHLLALIEAAEAMKEKSDG